MQTHGARKSRLVLVVVLLGAGELRKVVVGAFELLLSCDFGIPFNAVNCVDVVMPLLLNATSARFAW